MRYLILFAAVALCSSCNSVTRRAAASWSIPNTQELCERAHGEWANFGMPGDPGSRPSCKIDAPDAGKVCRSSDECLSGLCIPKGYVAPGASTTGACAAYKPANGCHMALYGGEAVQLPCVM